MYNISFKFNTINYSTKFFHIFVIPRFLIPKKTQTRDQFSKNFYRDSFETVIIQNSITYRRTAKFG
jgi:hypothetical protein